MEQAACPSCGHIKQPGEFGAIGECSQCGAPFASKPNSAISLEKRQAASRKRAIAKADIKAKNKEIKTLFIATIVLFTIALGMYLFNPSQKIEINEQANTQEAKEIAEYMKRSFAQPNLTASWYYSIEHIEINQTENKRTIDVSTTTEQRSSPVGNNICNAVSNYWQSHKNSFTGIRIIGIGGEITNYRYSLNNKCS